MTTIKGTPEAVAATAGQASARMPAHAAVTTTEGLLAGIRVLDLSVALAGPLATLWFVDMGAEVIRVEAPDGNNDISRWNPPFIGERGTHFGSPAGDDISVSTLNRTRGKKSVTLNLKSDAGRAMFLGLAEQADVVIENYSAGTADRLGVGYADVAAVNPAIVYCSISGFGQENAYPDLKAMDIIIQAMSGIMEATGETDGAPTRIGIPIGDISGALFASSGMLAALVSRYRTGVGRHVDVSLCDCLTSLVSIEHFELYERAGIPTKTGNIMARMTPFGVYPAKDGYAAISAHTDLWFTRLVTAMGRPELATDPRFLSRGLRVQHMTAVTELVETWTRGIERDELVRLLNDEFQVPAAPVRTPAEAVSDAHLASRGGLVPVSHPRHGEGDEPVVGTGLPVRFSGIPDARPGRAPVIGEHNADVYGERLGLDAERLAVLRADGVI